VFVVTNSKDAPYLTEVDEQSRRSGFFYLGPQEALAALNDIKAFDPKASLSVVSLESVYFDISKSAVEAASAPQPTAGTSTDLRLFRLRPLQDSAALADREKDATLKPDDVPLYYDVSLLLTVDGTAQRPYFFRLQDLKRTYEQQSGKKLANLPSLSVTTLDALVGHHRRYTRTTLRAAHEGAGLEVVAVHYVDSLGVLPWWVVGRLLRARSFDGALSRLYDRVGVPASRLCDRLLADVLGKNLFLVARRPT
jgi:hypothetical protein